MKSITYILDVYFNKSLSSKFQIYNLRYVRQNVFYKQIGSWLDTLKLCFE